MSHSADSIDDVQINVIERDYDDALRAFFSQGGSLRLLADADQGDLDMLHGYANQLFEAGDFSASRNFYYLLARVDHWNFEYWLGLGLCYQRLSEHERALFAFSRAGMIRISDPHPSFFAGISYRIVGNTAYARKAFNASLKWCGNRTEYEYIRRTAATSLAHCILEKQA